MSVGAYVNNPQNDQEKKFFIPVSSERFFNSYWLPACEVLDLRWIKCFSPGISIFKEDILEVIRELNRLKDWAIKNLADKDLVYMTKRIDLLVTQLPLVFTRDDLSVFIG